MPSGSSNGFKVADFDDAMLLLPVDTVLLERARRALLKFLAKAAVFGLVLVTLGVESLRLRFAMAGLAPTEAFFAFATGLDRLIVALALGAGAATEEIDRATTGTGRGDGT